MPNINTLLARRLTDHGVDLLRVSAYTQRKINTLLHQLENELVSQLSATDLTAYSQARLQSLLSGVRSAIDDTMSATQGILENDLTNVARTEAHVVTAVTNNTFGFDIMDQPLPAGALAELVADTLIQGAPNASWWDRQAAELQFRFAQQIRLGMSLGETNAQLVTRIRGADGVSGVVDRTAGMASSLVRTGVQTVANSARLEVFKGNSDVIQGVQQISTLDNRTSDICIAYDNQAWTLDGDPFDDDTDLPFDGGPPRHWNCRSVLIPITKSWKDMGVPIDEFDDDTRASADGELAADTSFGSWFNSKNENQQDDILGAGKASLWRDGKISQTDLVNQSGRPLSLADLQAKHGVSDA